HPKRVNQDVIYGAYEEENPGEQQQFVLEKRQQLPKIKVPQVQADPSPVRKLTYLPPNRLATR
ncbi:MAG: hypothetical protein AAGA34_11495, partial [Pseudomonadota bacterium]